MGAALVSRRSAGRYERAGLHGAALVSSRKDWKAGRPLPQLRALPFNFGLFPLCSSTMLLTCGVGANSANPLPSPVVVARFKEIQASASRLGACPRTHAFRRDDVDHVVYCFVGPDQAKTFQAQFGGDIMGPEDRPRWPSRK
jgi:hypothetical protein